MFFIECLIWSRLHLLANVSKKQTLAFLCWMGVFVSLGCRRHDIINVYFLKTFLLTSSFSHASDYNQRKRLLQPC